MRSRELAGAVLLLFAHVSSTASGQFRDFRFRLGRDKATDGGCDAEHVTFELVTGFVLNLPPKDMHRSEPGVLMLSDCIKSCRNDPQCRSINFETGLCVMLNTTADDNPGKLAESQFPVFTLYAQKICLKESKACSRSWGMERVNGFYLEGFNKKKRRVESKVQCIDMCMQEKEFVCRSANFEPGTGDCSLSDMSRHALTTSKRFKSDVNFVYLENNCVTEPIKMCEFQKIPGRILKTVDSVEQDVKSLEACRDKCLGSLEPCRSYDFNDTGNSVCRLSHHTALTLAHIKEPYLSMSTAVTYEMTACYNIEVQCRGTDMLAKIKSTKLFNGKIYAKESPMGCMSSIQDSMEFELSMPYESKACKVTKSLPGEYTNQIVVQHHKNIVTSADLGLSLICMYDLGSRNVTNNVSLEVEGKIEQIVTEEAYVESPDIIMRITDRKGNDISFAQVGDSLKLVFEISDNRYDLMVTKLYALDGIDALEIPLIDDEGCPTETFIMGPIERYEKNTDDDGEEKKQDASKKRFQILETKFEAFKFPVSDIVSFRALVTPCVHSCPPVTCDVLDFNGGTARIQSYGRRKRSPVQDFLRKKRSTKDDDLFVIQSITISDKYGRSRSNRRLGGDAVATGDSLNTTVTEVTIQGSTDAGVCINMVGIIVACSLFLVAQLVVIVAWTYIWQKRRQNKLEDGPIPETTADSLTQLFNSGYPARRF